MPCLAGKRIKCYLHSVISTEFVRFVMKGLWIQSLMCLIILCNLFLLKF